MRFCGEKYNICGENIKIIRKKREISQSILAGKAQLLGLNIDKKTISLIESGQRKFADYEIITLARALEIPTYYITDGIPANFV